MQEASKEFVLRLKAVIETAIDGIITIDNMGLVETINPSAAKLFGYHPSEIIGNNIKMLMPEPYHSAHDGYLERYERTKEARIIGIGREVIGKKKGGDEFPFRLGVSEVILHDRIIYTGIIHDLSEIKKSQEDLKQLNARLELKVRQRTEELEDAVNSLLKVNKKLEKSETDLKGLLDKERELGELKSRFVSMASHEFRTPLSTIMSSASLIGKYVDEAQNDKRLKHVGRIKSAVSNLTGILNDFLSLSKIEEGKIEITPEIFDLKELCDQIILELKGLLKTNQKIEKKLLLDDCTIKTDKRILKNILFNLLSNAIKYSPESSTIVCQFLEENEHYTIRIIDEGIGIPDYDQKHLFQRFFRATNVENIQGTGLGLSIVKRYADLLDLQISFESIENEGTTFTLNIKKDI